METSCVSWVADEFNVSLHELTQFRTMDVHVLVKANHLVFRTNLESINNLVRQSFFF